MHPIWILKLPLFIFFLFLFSCATTNTEKQETSEIIAPKAIIDGIWSGEFDIAGKGPYDFTALHIGGTSFAYSLKAKAMCVGTVKLDADNYISKYVLFALDGGPFDWATITGKLDEESTITSHFVTLNGGDTGALNMSYNSLYESTSSLDLTKGDWNFTDRDDLTTKFSIVDEGTLEGEDSDGCLYLGYVDLIDQRYNAYQLKVQVTECASVSGEYEGIGYIEENIFKVQLANDKYAFFYAFESQ